ncbi:MULTISPECIES: heavy metal translocating P-type ATPase [unclassified Exiguobacterium]|uniref:heavy metal translocating P-type ATPase n=1 Tax=unclassified Exiguobacterium TaxID=2644629 RepID=UPI00103AA45F|nr:MULTISPECIES: heavy metal translocating P-type ATPase [unclassified Exiguobacterium]TCI35140.1 cadmium-translocating P-type ATPase [Exiguobacterium sp. SH4S7]TCI44686.1 cadmium-translocating P-type ATPase [Exiguobacterium sp. SH5S32]TCI51093.1 cadmium-translocating P-type ATPase [Exiguobacterium sp. SH1S4]TCI59835.1 cadmium-translocating P-type ATPase [Exiguobacterium sp. SH0S2]TCI70067.1 cadmium-translocating P-type ATPase [Exiguobacterium sp. SH1S1]
MESRDVLPVEGITCTNCAAKIEKSVSEQTGVASCQIDFATSRMIIEWIDPSERETALRSIEETMGRIEPGAHFVKTDQIEQASNHLLWRFGIALSLLVLALLTESLPLYVVAYAVAGYDVVYAAARNVWHREWFDEKFLMTIATIGAFAIREYPEAVAVMLFYQLGEYFQGRAVHASRRSIQSLLNMKPTMARVLGPDGEFERRPEDVAIGSVIIVRAGEQVPMDGSVVIGSSSLDTASLTGESVPRQVGPHDEVLAGMVNLEGRLEVRVIRSATESSLQKMIALVEQASSNKAKTEQMITRLARVYTPIVVVLAAIVAFIPPLFVGNLEEWVYRALIFLVISCPCALVISIPLGYFGGIGAGSKRGILVKGGEYLDVLAEVKTVIFDKTGTLTTGRFEVTDVTTNGDVTEAELLTLAARVEMASTHPLAKAIVAKASKTTAFANITEDPGYGLTATDSTDTIYVGSARFMRKLGHSIQDEQMGTSVHVMRNDRWLGRIELMDTVKEDAAAAIAALKRLGYRTVMLTGDRDEVATSVGLKIGIDEVKSELLPHQKVEEVEKLAARGKVAFVGDGLNDAAALARADVGLVMGGIGSDAAVTAADLVLMNDAPSDVVAAIELSQRTKRIVWQNIILAFGMKALFLLLGVLGLASMWEAVFADVGVALLAIGNATRLIRSN